MTGSHQAFVSNAHIKAPLLLQSVMATTPSVVTPSLFGKVSTSFCCPCYVFVKCMLTHLSQDPKRRSRVRICQLSRFMQQGRRAYFLNQMFLCLFDFLGGIIYEIKFGPPYLLAARLLATALSPWVSTHLCLRLGRGEAYFCDYMHNYMTHVHESISQNNYFLSLLSPRGLFQYILKFPNLVSS